MMANSAERIAEHLLPNGQRKGGEWKCGSVDGEPGDSLGVVLVGAKAGVWKDFANDVGGDLLDLWMNAKRLTLPQAMVEAKDFMGIRDVMRDANFQNQTHYVKPPKQVIAKVGGKVSQYLTETRKLSIEAIQTYKIAASKDDTEIVFPFLRDGELLNVKRLKIDRKDGKKMIRSEKGCEPVLFGWQAIPDNARSVTICEGEIDAVTLWQYGFPALSMFSGASNLQWVDGDYPYLDQFSEIYICTDGDEPGKQAALALVERLGRDRCKVVTLPKKDANECLCAGISHDEIKSCFAKSATQDPVELKSAADYTDEVIREFYPPDDASMGVFLPWSKIGSKIMLRPSELSIWTGINGHGKSLLLGQVLASACTQSERVCIASMEIKPKKTLHRMSRQIIGNAEPPIQTIRDVMSWMDGKIWIFDLIGTAKDERLIEVFKYARKRYGITHFVVDSLMKMGYAEDDHARIKQFVESLCDFKNEFDCHVHLVAHSKKAMDESHVPGKLDVKGTGAITDLADNVFSVWRNKAKEAGEGNAPEYDAILKCDKQRNGEWEGANLLWFDKSSLQYLESDRSRPHMMEIKSEYAAQIPDRKKASTNDTDMVDF